MAESPFCCAVDEHFDADRVLIHASWWPRCRYCGNKRGDQQTLRYTRSDGCPGMSYPVCGDCRPREVARLERAGFTLVSRDHLSRAADAPPKPTVGPDS